ncbi:class I SAM-dependent methyltransferase [Methyloceanibacter sp.]|uniref:class I SAM-dependent methyltransferase n=1 Tax=Methyloceanibacter sp. TaxID=1965321 RepID=UPI003D6CBD7E
MGPPRSRAKLDERSRTAKAQKIAMLSGIVRPSPGATMLYFGSGSDYIPAYFSKLGFGEAGTFAVGVVDSERVSSGYQFTDIRGTELPFPDGRFDFIISNHVIKHFAGREQHTHLAEIGRCLRDGGKLYIAVPNRWGLIDAHYRLPLLGWLPRHLAHSYLRLTRKADKYEWYPLSRQEILRLLQLQGFQAEDVTLRAIRLAVEKENTGLPRLVSGLPAWIWRLLRPVVPTLFFVCTNRESGIRKGIGQIGGGR